MRFCMWLKTCHTCRNFGTLACLAFLESFVRSECKQPESFPIFHWVFVLTWNVAVVLIIFAHVSVVSNLLEATSSRDGRDALLCAIDDTDLQPPPVMKSPLQTICYAFGKWTVSFCSSILLVIQYEVRFSVVCGHQETHVWRLDNCQNMLHVTLSDFVFLEQNNPILTRGVL